MKSTTVNFICGNSVSPYSQIWESLQIPQIFLFLLYSFIYINGQMCIVLIAIELEIENC